MSEEKPLHERVAEALGWELRPFPQSSTQPKIFCREGGTMFWRSPEGEECCTRCMTEYPPRYDTDWSATGPLIEKYGIRLDYNGEPVSCACNRQRGAIGDVNMNHYCYWEAESARLTAPSRGCGSTPLIAICELILKLSASGKLDSAAQRAEEK